MIYRLVELSEHQVQSTFFKWVRIAEKQYPALRLMFAVPNAAKRSFKLAAMLKAEGMRHGVPDVLLPVARYPFIGLAIEFKKPDGKNPTGKLSDYQIEFIDFLVKENWLVCVLDDAEEAIRITKNYLDIK